VAQSRWHDVLNLLGFEGPLLYAPPSITQLGGVERSSGLFRPVPGFNLVEVERRRVLRDHR
jgi:hypothetical protein